MKRVSRVSCKVLAGLLFSAVYATPQAYTISAKSGALNYVEGTAYLNGNRLSGKTIHATFLGANDSLSTDIGKAEVLLSPGVFLRIGDNSQIRMISPSLVNTQVEVKRGEAMIEIAGLVKDNTVQVTDHGGSITLERDGLYRINADDPATVAVLDGKASVSFGNQEASLSKGRELVLSDGFKTAKFNTKKPDDLYAWSNVRSEYDAAASYQTAKNVGASSFGGWGGYGFSGFSSPGWYWANGFDSFAYLPGAGAFYSPFGYGFYSPGAVGYAPVVWGPVYRGTSTGRNGVNSAVPVNPNSPAAVGYRTASPAANSAARAQVAQSFAATGFRTSTGAPVAAFSGTRMMAVSTGGHVGVASSDGGGRAISGGQASVAGAGGGHAGSSGLSGGGHGGGSSHK